MFNHILNILMYTAGNWIHMSENLRQVMIVDDDRPFTRLAVLGFESAGFLAYPAYDGASAVELYASKHPDVIVLDVAMPELNGYQLAEKIREMEQAAGPSSKRTLIVIMTAHS